MVETCTQTPHRPPRQTLPPPHSEVVRHCTHVPFVQVPEQGLPAQVQTPEVQVSVEPVQSLFTAQLPFLGTHTPRRLRSLQQVDGPRGASAMPSGRHEQRSLPADSTEWREQHAEQGRPWFRSELQRRPLGSHDFGFRRRRRSLRAASAPGERFRSAAETAAASARLREPDWARKSRTEDMPM